MTQVELFKKKSKYNDKDGQEKTATNFYVKCGDVLVPVEVKYFPDKDTNHDTGYASRKAVLSAFAEELPELKTNKKTVEQQNDNSAEKMESIDDDKIPF